FANWNNSRLFDLALELVSAKVDVIVAPSRQAARAAQRATASIPLVIATPDDPVAAGLVTSLARPGGNTTGISTINDETYPKQLNLLRSVVAQLSRAAFLTSPAIQPENPYLTNLPQPLESAAHAVGVTVRRTGVRNQAELEGA